MFRANLILGKSGIILALYWQNLRLTVWQHWPQWERRRKKRKHTRKKRDLLRIQFCVCLIGFKRGRGKRRAALVRENGKGGGGQTSKLHLVKDGGWREGNELAGT